MFELNSDYAFEFGQTGHIDLGEQVGQKDLLCVQDEQIPLRWPFDDLNHIVPILRGGSWRNDCHNTLIRQVISRKFLQILKPTQNVLILLLFELASLSGSAVDNQLLQIDIAVKQIPRTEGMIIAIGLKLVIIQFELESFEVDHIAYAAGGGEVGGMVRLEEHC